MGKQDCFQSRKQLCWTCQNATGGCSWSRSFTPVEGWVAEPRTIVYKSAVDTEHQTETYKIIECPKYIQDERID